MPAIAEMIAGMARSYSRNDDQALFLIPCRLPPQTPPKAIKKDHI
jgi:hypothetical protein